MNNSLEYAKEMDRKDILRAYRDEFYLIPQTVYMDGNSLGILSKRAEQSLLTVLGMWRAQGIDGWTQGEQPWYYLSEKLGEMCAHLVGASKEEVIITGSTTSNLHQLLSTFYKPTEKKTKILVDELNFPSDLYAVRSHLALHGLTDEHMKIIKGRNGHTLEKEDIIEAMSDDVAVIILPGVLYRSGQILAMEELTRAARERNILIGFDLCHSIGAIPHKLKEWDVDFAFWCTYKHLNGGPGSVAGLFVHERHLSKKPGLAGWFGSNKEKQFDLDIYMTPALTAGAFQIGTPHILSAAPLYGSLEMFQEAGMESIRQKSLLLTDYMMDLIDEELSQFSFSIVSPREATERGGHVFIVHEEAARICKALKERKVIPDFRAPNGIRLAPVALYNSFEDVWIAINCLKEIMLQHEYMKYENKRDVIA